MKENWEELRAAAKADAAKAPPLTEDQKAAIANAFRGVRAPWVTDKKRRTP